MSLKNVEVARATIEAVNRGDLEAFLALWDSDCEYRPALEGAVEGVEGVYIGHDGIREWWRAFHDEWSEVRAEVHEIRELGDRVVVLEVLRGRRRASGIPMEQRFGHVLTFRAGMLAVSEDYFSWEEAIEAVGLSDDAHGSP